MIVVDSSVWIAHLRGLDIPCVRKLRALDNPGDILVGDIILLEVLQGARDDRHAHRIERNLRQFTFARMLDRELSVEAARNYRHLRALGNTVRKTIDLIVGSYCLRGGHRLLHDDRDFDAMAVHLGLSVA